ncbi:lysylphosphatidylglycerol synthase domain-containing protein [Thermocrinis sp.]
MKKLFPLILSLAFLILLFYYLPPEEILSFLRLITIESFLLASFFYGLSHLTRSIRWKILLEDLSLFQTFLINSANVFLNNLLPARTGELSWFYYSKRMGVELKKSLGVFLLGRLLDLLGLVVVFLFLYALQSGRIEFYLVSGLFVLLPFFFVKFMKTSITSTAFAYLLSGLSVILKFSSLVVLMDAEPSVGLFLSFSGGELSSVLPIHTFGGFGTYELSFSLPQKLLSEPLKDLLQMAFVFHVFLLLSSALYGLPSVYLLHRKKFKP